MDKVTLFSGVVYQTNGEPVFCGRLPHSVLKTQKKTKINIHYMQKVYTEIISGN